MPPLIFSIALIALKITLFLFEIILNFIGFYSLFVGASDLAQKEYGSFVITVVRRCWRGISCEIEVLVYNMEPFEMFKAALKD